MQNFENILSSIASLSVLPTISPRAFNAQYKSDAINSAGRFFSAPFFADIQKSTALCNDCACRADTRISSADAVI